jgi:hypothetical protein
MQGPRELLERLLLVLVAPGIACDKCHRYPRGALWWWWWWPVVVVVVIVGETAMQRLTSSFSNSACR